MSETSHSGNGAFGDRPVGGKPEALSHLWQRSHRELDPKALRRAITDNLKFRLGVDPRAATKRDVYASVAYSVRDILVERLHASNRAFERSGQKTMGYLSMEFLIGRLLVTNLLNLGLMRAFDQALAPLKINVSDLGEVEPEAGLGNGGLGRLAACFLDSLATHSYPATGYGIRYEHGMFRQAIVDGAQVEQLDNWLRFPNPWEIPRPHAIVKVDLFGRVVQEVDANGAFRPRWIESRPVLGVPYDTPIVGFGGRFVNVLRLWAAKATSEMDLDLFNRGDYSGAAERKNLSETISKILYPNDAAEHGRELRLVQEAFFVTCSVADLLRRFSEDHTDLRLLPQKLAIQLNDTHPALAVVELLRVLIDVHHLDWELAWDLVVPTFGYTNHTLLPEALECWPVPLMEKVLPRHMQLIREIDRRFRVVVVRSHPNDPARADRLGVLAPGPVEQVRMAHVAVIGSHAVNGVSALHTDLLKRELFREFHELDPSKITNKTNGVTPRLWIFKANPRLAALLTREVGDGWVTRLERVGRLRARVDDADLQGEFSAVKFGAKMEASAFIEKSTEIRLDPSMIFDVHIKRLHEYKRQLMNILGTLVRFRRIKAGTAPHMLPRAMIFAGKAAPGYVTAKLILRFICRVADVINRDPDARGRLSVVFLPNYSVSLAEKLIPAADISEQISTAGCEASGTGNMKFAMNGALTLGTLDGANIELRDAVGHENFFTFGHTEGELHVLKRDGYEPRQVLAAHDEIAQALTMMVDGSLSPEDPDLFRPLFDALVNHGDRFFVLADMPAWLEAQDRVDALRRTPAAWTRAALLNIAGSGPFSSDRTIHEYASEIWNLRQLDRLRTTV